MKAKGDPRDGPGGTRAPLRRVALSKVVMLKTRSSQKATWAAQAPRRHVLKPYLSVNNAPHFQVSFYLIVKL